MKGNDGKAARRKVLRRLFMVLSIAGIIISVLVVVSVKTFTSSSTETSGGGGGNADPTSRAAQVLHKLHEHGSHAASNANQALRRRASNGAQNVQNWMQNQQHGGKNERHHQQQAAADDDGRRGGNGPADDDAEDADVVDEALQDILAAKLHIVNIRPTRRRNRGRQGNGNSMVEFNMHGGYTGLTAQFCQLDWSLQKKDPTQVSMFHDLVDKSEACYDSSVEYDLYDIVQAAREYDQEENNNNNAGRQEDVVKVLNLTGVVFHESRCGSTLVANTLAAMNPAQHRVYSESTPPISILRMAENDGSGVLSVSEAATILQDVIYLMSRSNDLREERVFFKFQSISTRSISVFQQAFPKTPWIFVYRDPVQVLMSHLGVGRMRDANCVRPQAHPADAVERLVEKYDPDTTNKEGGGGAGDLSPQDFCAAHLASLTESAVEHMNQYGTPVNYVDLPHLLYDDILPNRWHVPTGQDEIHRIQQISTQYSKQGRQQVTGKEFKGDSDNKDKMASPQVRAAAQRYLQPSFEALERVAQEKKNLHAQ